MTRNLASKITQNTCESDLLLTATVSPPARTTQEYSCMVVSFAAFDWLPSGYLLAAYCLRLPSLLVPTRSSAIFPLPRSVKIEKFYPIIISIS